MKNTQSLSILRGLRSQFSQKARRAAGVLGLAAFTSLFASGASAQSFGECDTRMFHVASENVGPTYLRYVNQTTTPFTYTDIGQTPRSYNALAYRRADNYLYGLTLAGSLNPPNNDVRLMRIGASGVGVDLGLVTGLPTTPGTNFVAGDFADDGYYYVFTASANTNFYRIDLNASPITATAVPFVFPSGVTTIGGSDIAWVNGLFYTVTILGQLRSLNPTTGEVVNIGLPSVGGTYGALWGGTNGLFGALNGGGFYQINLSDGTKTLISNSPVAGNTDGALCSAAAVLFDADVSITNTDNSSSYTPGTPVTYTITVTNNSTFDIQNATVANLLPAGITSASWTCTGANGGTCEASGTGAINDATVDLPAGATVTYLLTINVPSDFRGSLVSTATVALPSPFRDPTPHNNTATDIDFPPQQPVPLHPLSSLLLIGLLLWGARRVISRGSAVYK